jgi:predicted RNA-binding protein YlqC (UPF0109 family)
VTAVSADAEPEALVRHVVEGLVDNPEDISIERSEKGRNISLEITVHDDDIGKVIGRQGRIIRSLRVIARAAGVLDGKQVYVDVVG